MTPQEQTRFNDLFELFSQPGWKIYQDELMAQHNALRYSAVDQESPDSFNIAKGFIRGLTYSLNFEELVKNTYDNSVGDEQDD